MFLAVWQTQWSVLFVTFITLVGTFVPKMVETRYKIKLPLGFTVAIIGFMYATLFWGELHDFYERFWWWDVALHAGAAIGFGLIGFTILYVIYRGGYLQASPFLVALFAFCFSLAIGATWEIFEFSLDWLFGLDMQKSGLADTMGDLIVDSVGAFVTAGSGYLYLKNKETNWVGASVERFLEKNRQFMDKFKH
jgi:hypothetical protein